MTQVCLVGDPDVNLAYELLSRETARDALSTYDITEPFENSIAVETVSLGAAVSLLNDLNWYLVRFTREAMIRDPSIDPDEWLSRALARQVREGAIRPEETDQRVKLFGLREGHLADPRYVLREQGSTPKYETASERIEVVAGSPVSGDGSREAEGGTGAEGETGAGDETGVGDETEVRDGTEADDGAGVDDGTKNGAAADVEDTVVVRVSREEFPS